MLIYLVLNSPRLLIHPILFVSNFFIRISNRYDIVECLMKLR